MSEEKETKLSEDELNQVAGGKPAVTGTVAKPPADIYVKLGNIPGESLLKGHTDQ